MPCVTRNRKSELEDGQKTVKCKDASRSSRKASPYSRKASPYSRKADNVPKRVDNVSAQKSTVIDQIITGQQIKHGSAEYVWMLFSGSFTYVLHRYLELLVSIRSQVKELVKQARENAGQSIVNLPDEPRRHLSVIAPGFDFDRAFRKKSQKARAPKNPRRVWNDLQPRCLKSVDGVDLIWHFPEFLKPDQRV